MISGESNKMQIITALTLEIADKMAYVASEREAPRFDADKSDDLIKDGKATIKELQRIRFELERIFFGDIGE